MSQSSLPVFLVYPDPESATYVQSVLEAYGLGSDYRPIHSLDEFFAVVEKMEDRFIAFCEVFWDGADASDIFLSLSLTYPRGGFAIASQGPVAEYLPRDYPIPHCQGLGDTERIATLFTDLSEDMRHQNFGPYHIEDFAGQSSLGQVYRAMQPAIKRQVHLTIPYLSTSEEALSQFKARAAAQARNSFPSIYSIYEESEIAGRRVTSSEPINGPSLFQFYLEGSTFDSRLVAKILHIAGGALKHLHNQQIPHPRIKSKHITISENGVIKLHNTALPPGDTLPGPQEETKLLAEIAESFLDPQAENDPQLLQLIEEMKSGTVDLSSVSFRANQIDIDLAPVKAVPEREKAKKAAEEVEKARKSIWVWAVIGGGAVSALLIVVLIHVINIYLIVHPATNFSNQMEIPAGPVMNSRTKETIEIPRFYMDEFEVTIGQYEQFLKETAGQDISSLLPPNYVGGKSDFRPRDWNGIIAAVKRKKFYLGEKINRDTPIFNVDYADALAYAKWAGKRLPTELEWMRAASGDQHFKLPWGNEPDPSRANTGADREKTADNGSPGSIDGFRGPAEVHKHRKTDVSPFGVKNMAGNVSEWVEMSPELGELKGDEGVQRGGNHGYHLLVSNQKRLTYSLNTSQPWLGIRLVSDQPVKNPPLD